VQGFTAGGREGVGAGQSGFPGIAGQQGCAGVGLGGQGNQAGQTENGNCEGQGVHGFILFLGQWRHFALARLNLS